MKRVSAGALVLSAWTLLAGCSSGDPTLIHDDSALQAGVGSARLSLVVGDRNISTVTAVISAKHGGFDTQTHSIDVSGSGVISIFFGNLPVGSKYKIELSAADCNGSANFQIDAGQTTLVPVTLTCGGGEGSKETGSAQITGTIVGGSGTTPACDHITKMVAAPSIQNGSGPNPSVEIVLNEGVAATSIVWSTSSTTGGTGTIGSLSGTTDREITFDCATNGTVYVVADVVALENGASCTEKGRVAIECLNQGATVCGNGIVEGAEQCDGAAGVGTCPAGTTGTVTCAPQCTRNTAGCIASNPCGNGVLDTGEQCDGALGVGSCPAGQTGTVTCTPQCTRNTAGCVGSNPCGNGVLDTGEQCDGSLGLGTCPAGTTGTVTCTPQCTRNTAACVSSPMGACGTCAAANCALQRADVDANLSTVEPIVECVLGANWEAGQRAAATSCGNVDLLTCYCGTLSGQDCANAAPSALNGQCVAQVLAGTGCTTSSCVAPIFLNPANANGKAMQYIQCQQDFCYDDCFNP